MHPISWLHISDIHMRLSDAWSHDVVLKAMCDDIARQRNEGASFDFVLVTGDVAFSGNVDEYHLATGLFDAISTASGAEKERIFCVPGNHDVDRERQKLCFVGARNYFESQNRLDALLYPGEELDTLLKREENYRNFQRTYFSEQARTGTADGLGYVSLITIDGVKLAIVGLDSAWLANGGIEDHGKLLIGERQAINGLSLANTFNPHIIIAMAHHPFHVLQEFDRVTVQNRIEHGCHFFHCGHLHEPESRNVGPTGSGCLTLTAGASFETRQSHNTYSSVMLDLPRGERTVTTIQYNPVSGGFAFKSCDSYPIEIVTTDICSVGELALAMKVYRPSLSRFAHYLSALLLNAKSEIPIPTQNGYTFGSFAVLKAQPNTDLKRSTVDFMAFQNVLRVFYTRLPLADIFTEYGETVAAYAIMLEQIATVQPDIQDRLTGLENDSQILAATEPRTTFSHAVALFTQLSKEHEWSLLREQAKRHLQSADRSIAVQAKRMLALSLAHGEQVADRIAAAELYGSLMQEGAAEASDAGNFATLLIDLDNFEGAQKTVLDGIEKFPVKATDYFFQIGQKIVEATGSREFRRQLENAIKAKGKRD
jgi:predicted phosphodiesterase